MLLKDQEPKTYVFFSISAHCVPDAPTNREIEDEGIAIGEPNATLNTDASKFRHLRDKLQQWNSDLKKRRNSQVCCRIWSKFKNSFYQFKSNVDF